MEEAAARRERLKALKEAAAGGQDSLDEPQTTTGNNAGPQLKFRNYAVRDEKHIQHEKVNRGFGVCRSDECVCDRSSDPIVGGSSSAA